MSITTIAEGSINNFFTDHQTRIFVDHQNIGSQETSSMGTLNKIRSSSIYTASISFIPAIIGLLFGKSIIASVQYDNSHQYFIADRQEFTDYFAKYLPKNAENQPCSPYLYEHVTIPSNDDVQENNHYDVIQFEEQNQPQYLMQLEQIAQHINGLIEHNLLP